jgi:CheY-like chemotaxis protein
MPHSKPILLVDDDLNDIELVTEALKRNNLNNNIVAARHGGEALDYLFRRGAYAQRGEEEDPIFVLLDLKMPKVDGLEVLRQVKSDEKLKLIPIIMLTSSREEPDLIKSYRLGVNAYVVKPVEFGQFVDAIKQVGDFWALLNESPPLPAAARWQ